MTVHASYCRICSGLCGILVTVEGGVATHIQGDRDNPLTRGFTCPKGRRWGDLHAAPERFRESQRRGQSGDLEPVPVSQAIEEIGERLSTIIDEHGPDSVAFFVGTQSYTSTLTFPFASAWQRALGTHKYFSTNTIDQSAKFVAAERLGSWRGGRQRFEDSDVWLLTGSNPLVSMQGGEVSGFPVHGGPRRLRAAQDDGLTFIVVDPRRTESAARADLHLQLAPGTDASLYAGLLNVILSEDLHDAEFCATYVDGLELLRTAVAPATPERVETVTGVPAALLVEAARAFGSAGRGMATSGTGANMGPDSNISEHLLQALNVVCGRFPRAGDRMAGGSLIGGPKPGTASVRPPSRPWESGYKSRVGDHGMLYGNQLPTGILPDEILQPGDDRVRALVVSGGNPANCIPDQRRAVEALTSLELLVTVEPYPTETAELADYVIAPALGLERADHTRPNESWFSEDFGQFTDAVLPPPEGVIEDWQFWLRLGQAMGMTLQIGQRTWAPDDDVPSSLELLESFGSRARIPLAEVRQHQHGVTVWDLDPVRVEPGDHQGGRFDLCAPDVAAEITAALGPATPSGRPFRLIVRRDKKTMNTLGRRLDGHRHNPLHVHPGDLRTLGLADDDLVDIESDHGRIRAVVTSDTTAGPGVVSMTHCYGALPDHDEDPRQFGANPARLLSHTHGRQTINAMPQMTAVPVSLRRVQPS
ncbi:MAG: molybdopterin oxidoreductase [Marmoricola sp.]|nr:molybdopterin oxidoreductase [Marmoricola sp.]